jgi:membrane protease YdiL (CAAX protease family)
MKTRIVQDEPSQQTTSVPPTDRPVHDRTGLRAWVRRHRLISFIVLACALSWWGEPLYAFGVFPEPVFLPLGPLLGAVIVIGLAEGRPGFRDLGRRIVRWRVSWYWYAVAIAFPLAIRFVAAGLNVAAGAPMPHWTSLAWGSFALAFASRLVDPLNAPIGEEPGFRGFAVPRLQATRSPLVSTAILGALVSGWHLPLVLTGELGPVGLLGTVGVTFIYVWLFNRSGGSVLLTLIFHAMEGSILFEEMGFVGSDSSRMEILYSVVVCFAAVILVVFDRPAWRTAPHAARYTPDVPRSS